jgi:polyphosphate kinase 2 (PPK2 family)
MPTTHRLEPGRSIRRVFRGVNPQGVRVTSFKKPSMEDLAHDFLWRIHKAAPAAGMIGVFNIHRRLKN